MQTDNKPQVNPDEHSTPVHHLWDPSQRKGGHDNLYRLRIWVTHDNEERGNCPCQTFTFKTLDLLKEATAVLRDTFEGPSSSCKVKKCGVGHLDDEGRIDKGKMEAVVIDYDTLESKESWKEFLDRVNSVKRQWVLDA